MNRGSLPLIEKRSYADPETLIGLLRGCKHLTEGHGVHTNIVYLGLENDLFIANYLITMYGNWNSSVEDAFNAFQSIKRQNVVSWTSIITVHVKKDQNTEALSLFYRMQSLSIKPNRVTFASVLRACANVKDLVMGLHIHSYVIECGFELDMVLNNSVLNMYGKCGMVSDARLVFDVMCTRDVVSWTTMIVANAQHGYENQALHMFQMMLSSDVTPNAITTVNILSACASVSALHEGKNVHFLTIESGLEFHQAVANALLSFYGHFGCLDDAEHTFSRIVNSDQSNWATMVSVYTLHGLSNKALHLFDQMRIQGMAYDKVSVLTALNACRSSPFVASGQEIHIITVKIGCESDVEVANSLLSMYNRCGRLDNVENTFLRLCVRDIVSWTTMIVSYVQHGFYQKAIDQLNLMIYEGVNVDIITFVSILSVCEDQSMLQLGLIIHEKVLQLGLESDVVLGNALLSMYGKCGCVLDAHAVFDLMLEKSTISWNAMISSYVINGNVCKSFDLFKDMMFHGVKVDKVSFLNILSVIAGEDMLFEGKLTHGLVVESALELESELAVALITMYGKCCSIEEAKRIFDKLHHKDVVAWTAMIAACDAVGDSNEILIVYHKMQSQDVKPDKFTMSLAVSACSNPDMLEEGERFHEYMIQNGIESDILLENALVNMYGKCGNVVKAQNVFEKMFEHDLFSFNAMIAAHAQHLHSKEAFELYQQMLLEGIVPDKVSYITILLACSSCLDMKVGKAIHALLSSNRLEQDSIIGNAIVNMYSKCGSVDNAWATFNELPKYDIVSCSTMVAACANHGDINKAMEVFDLMECEGFEPNEVSFVSALSACSQTGSVEEAFWFLIRMSRCSNNIIMNASLNGCLIDLLTRVGRLDVADEFVNKCPSQPGVLEWMPMLSASKLFGDMERAKQIANHLLELDQDCIAAYVVLANTYVTTTIEDIMETV